MSAASTASTQSLFQTQGKDRYKLTKNVEIEIGGNKYTLSKGTFLFSTAAELKIPMGYLVKMVNENKSYEKVHEEFESPKIGPRTSYFGWGGVRRSQRRPRRNRRYSRRMIQKRKE